MTQAPRTPSWRAALSLFTVLPAGAPAELDAAGAARAIFWLPAVGVLISLVAAGGMACVQAGGRVAAAAVARRRGGNRAAGRADRGPAPGRAGGHGGWAGQPPQRGRRTGHHAPLRHRAVWRGRAGAGAADPGDRAGRGAARLARGGRPGTGHRHRPGGRGAGHRDARRPARRLRCPGGRPDRAAGAGGHRAGAAGRGDHRPAWPWAARQPRCAGWPRRWPGCWPAACSGGPPGAGWAG